MATYAGATVLAAERCCMLKVTLRRGRNRGEVGQRGCGGLEYNPRLAASSARPLSVHRLLVAASHAPAGTSRLSIYCGGEAVAS